ncbi:MAG TPA: elongation factor G [Dictyoglomaceae bacterium]|nr:elongation factor G [Dictyoglomaceae bacterium]HOL40082.1 elongation factor G [Dictyoglomaceae bacterium]HPP16590.1 elongation factor G [Dictyoglomaceae bacterium]
MKYVTEDLRNVGFFGHGSAGKTTLAEAVLYTAKVIDRMGRVENGNTVSDFEPEEIKRGISLSLSILPLEWKNKKINLVDTPGYADFISEMRSAIRAIDSMLIVIDAISGIQVQTERAWSMAEEEKLPVAFVINKLDRENSDFFENVNIVQERFGNKALPIFIPIGKEDNFKGIVDLLEGKAYIYNDEKGEPVESEIPSELLSDYEKYRQVLIEAIIEFDDELLQRYLEGESIEKELIIKTLKDAFKNREIYPIFPVSSFKNVGVSKLLDSIISFFPNPKERAPIPIIDLKTNEMKSLSIGENDNLIAFVFKTSADPFVGKISFVRVFSGVLKPDSVLFNTTKGVQEKIAGVYYQRGKSQEPATEIVAGDIGVVTKLKETSTNDTLSDKENSIKIVPVEFPEPVFAVAVIPKSRADEDRMSSAIAKSLEEDPTLRVQRSLETNETLIYGLGDSHLEVVVERMQRKFGVNVTLGTPQVAYRETIRASTKAEGKVKKQTGGRGQYGHVWLELEPLPRGAGFEFVDKIVGGVVPKNYIPAVEKGVREAMEKGVLAGFPIVDVRVTLFDGSYHEVDSSDMAFKIAASKAFKKGFLDARPVLLEPIMEVEITAPDAYTGDIISDLNGRRGKVTQIESLGKLQVVKALVPLAEMLRYSSTLKSITQGRGSYSMKFSHYEEMPAKIQEEIIAKAKPKMEEEEE